MEKITFDSTGDTFVLQNGEYVSFISRFGENDFDESDKEALKEAFRNYRPYNYSFPYIIFLSITALLILLTVLFL